MTIRPRKVPAKRSRPDDDPRADHRRRASTADEKPRKQDHGITRDLRGQDQPKDKSRARQ